MTSAEKGPGPALQEDGAGTVPTPESLGLTHPGDNLRAFCLWLLLWVLGEERVPDKTPPLILPP